MLVVDQNDRVDWETLNRYLTEKETLEFELQKAPEMMKPEED